MESPLKWIFSKFSPFKLSLSRSSSKERPTKTIKRNTTPENKIKKVRVLETRCRAPLF